MYEFSENIQRGIIFLYKSDRDFNLQTSPIVESDFFEFPVHQRIFNVVSEHFKTYRVLPTDEIILETIRSDKRKGEVLADYEDELDALNGLDVTSIENKDYILDIVEDFSKTNALKMAIAESVNLIKDGKLGDIEDKIRKALMICRHINVGQLFFDDITNRWERIINTNNNDKFRTILPGLNKYLEGGNNRKEICMVVANSGVGKSLYLVNQGVTALMEGRNVLHISLEMSEDKIAQRYDSVMTFIPQSKLPEEQETLQKALGLFKEKFPDGRLVIKEFPTSQINVNSIRALITQLQNYHDFTPDLVILDYLEIMRPTSPGMPEYQAQQRIAEELRGLAVEYNALVWTATQPNRDGARVNIITESELADSFGKIRPCDFVISLNQTAEEFEEGKMRCYVIKSRNCRNKFIVPMDVNYGNLRMEQRRKEPQIQ